MRASPLLLAIVLVAGPASAHHPAPIGPKSMVPVSRAGLQVAAAEFDTTHRGYWQEGSLSFEYAFFERFSLMTRLPLAHITFSDGTSATGLGDIDLGTRVLIWASGDGAWGLVGGFSVELPSGDPERGLGDGHVMGTPMASVVFRPHRSTQLSLVVSDHIGFGDTASEPSPDAPTTQSQHVGGGPSGPSKTVPDGSADTTPGVMGSMLSPHSAHEMRVGLSGVYSLGPVFFTGASDVVVSFTAADALGPITASGGVGVQATERLIISLEVQAPIVDKDRLEWRAALGADVYF